MNALRRFAKSRAVDRMSHWVSVGSALMLMLMMGLIVFEVCLREIGGTSTKIAHDFSGYMLVAVALWSAAEVMSGGKHINVTVVTDRLRPRARGVLWRIGHVLTLVLSAVLFYSSALLVVRSLANGTVTGGLYQIPVFIPQLAIPIGFFFLMLQLFVNTLRLFWGDER
ncbi:MAG: TRAP transporter small permease [Dehalococcoidia bacterium]|nr:TRAP transporter small permease [Dehalococcoidia bacterium]